MAADVAAIVRPGFADLDDVVVRDRDLRLDVPLAQAAATARAAEEAAHITAAVRSMYRRVGIDPTKTRPSSEALLRRVRKGEALPRINGLVDVINWCSLESQLPFGLYDADRIRGAIVLRLGHEHEQYAGIRKDAVHVSGRLTLADDDGAFGNPTSDSARTMVTTATTRAIVVIFAPAEVAESAVARALALTRERVEVYCKPSSSVTRPPPG